METIITYLDNMFESLPKTKQMEDLKLELLSNMEDKYNELKISGKSENEAIGIVISEFGSVEELMKEFDMRLEEERVELPILTEDNANDYLRTIKKSSILIGLGVVLSILGASLVVLISQLIEDGYIAGLSENTSNMIILIPLFFLASIATGLFIYAVIILDKYKNLEFEYILPAHIRTMIKNKNNSYYKTFSRAFIISGIISILSPISLFIIPVISNISINYGVVALLIVIGVAIYIFIYYGGVKLGYNKLLKTGAYKDRTDKVISTVAAIVWPIAVIIYLVSGLVYHQWHINWIVFAVTGILYGMFTEAYKISKEKN